MKNTVLNAAYKAFAAALVIASSSSAPANAQTRTTIDHHHLVSASMAGGVGLSLRHIPQPQSERAQFLEDEGAANRVDSSGKLRMLSQRIPAAACNLAAGIDPETSAIVLSGASTEFEQIINALEFGDDDLGIFGIEERRKTLAGLRKLRELWDPMFTDANQIAQGNGSADLLTSIADESAEVLRVAILLVSEISGQYSNPAALLQADAITIDIAGRQRMLAQRISKNLCLVSSGINLETTEDELRSAAQIFETSLQALLNGKDDAGVRAPASTQIADGLQVVLQDWANLKPLVTKVLSGETLDANERALGFNGANTMTGNMNTVVGMYSQTSKQDL